MEGCRATSDSSDRAASGLCSLFSDLPPVEPRLRMGVPDRICGSLSAVRHHAAVGPSDRFCGACVVQTLADSNGGHSGWARTVLRGEYRVSEVAILSADSYHTCVCIHCRRFCCWDLSDSPWFSCASKVWQTAAVPAKGKAVCIVGSSGIN